MHRMMPSRIVQLTMPSGRRTGLLFCSLGDIFFDSLLDYCDPDTAKSESVYLKLKADAMKKLAKGGSTLLEAAMEMSESESESGGSDSSSSGGETEAATLRHKLGVQSLDDMALVVKQTHANLPSSRVQSAGVRRARKLKKKAKPSQADAEGNDGLEADDEMERSQASARRRKNAANSLRKKYANMSNNGIPTFSDDLIKQRQRRREKSAGNADASAKTDRIADGREPKLVLVHSHRHTHPPALVSLLVDR